jgi:WD40 repeat protein
MADLTNPQQLSSIPGEHAAFSPDGKSFISSISNTISFWDISNPTTALKLSSETVETEGPGPSIVDLTFSPDGKIAISAGCQSFGTYCIQGQIILWDVNDPQHLNQLAVIYPFQDGGVQTVAFDPSGKRLVSGSGNGTIALWDVSEPTNPVRIALLSARKSPVANPVTSLTFSTDGRYLISGNWEGYVLIWSMNDPSDPVEISSLAHTGPVTSVALSPSGTHLAVGGAIAISMWDLSEPTNPAEQATFSETVSAQFSFSPNGNYLAGSSPDLDPPEIVLWDMDPMHWAETSCGRIGRNFTRKEWTQYFPDEEYRAICPEWPLEPEPATVPSPTPLN